ncbi:glycoside hydrolase family 3 C-terminal domain-containing protein [Paenibacillus alginolyticus]|uniref:glycoside hydrolase family 3 C-terminal domain-containing protein n=1 Tax=Paenibacillus alginolyticus TaxID=59839 RepID=UPI00041114D7|nr:glycoside hydrolase family 3 C-terminal domain-containing protein [Paenibacillus alginolyticus]MCY9665351.1 glycoside hydrolase family 3 C-terminal domain-containing protein [Paenibacillus alginolyticus]
MKKNIQELISQMTLEEKASLCSGLDFWHTKGIERLGIPSVMMTDGPHGLRKQRASADNLGLFDSVPATCFPSAAGLASSWDRELIGKVGVALGEECQTEDVAILLGPGANIKRSPLCGRNFEYFSEDPYLSSEMAAAHIQGVQSQGVGTSLKHFAVNNQEHRRMTTNAVVDERTLREIYLASFEGAVKKGQPWTVMCAYNQLNGEYCAENERLLTDILKDDWGHEGFVVSDWGAVNERADGLAAGLELEMPTSNGAGDRKIVESVKSGRLSEKKLDSAVERILNIVFMAVDSKKPDASYDPEAHHILARAVARESMVLLKNEDGILPLPKSGKIAVIGQLAKQPRYQGGGSSHIKPTKLEDISEELAKSAGSGAEIAYAQGYELNGDQTNPQLLKEAIKLAEDASVVILFVGLPDRYESEGFDREHLNLPLNQSQLIEAVTAVQKRTVLVLSNGAPVEMPWIGGVKAVLEAYLGGQALGGAIADLLFGDANPCGKLAETFPVQLSDNSSYLNFPGDGDLVEYKEGIYVGYRYYDKKKLRPLFPFGHGLSYTTFEYSGLVLDKDEMDDTDSVNVSVNIKNTGSRVGKETVQLYVRDVHSSVSRPEKELKGFVKVALKPGEEKTVTFTLDKRSFAYFNMELNDWHVETGEFEILVGKSSADIVLKRTMRVNSTITIAKTYTRNSTVGDLMEDPQAASIVGDLLKHSPFGSSNHEGEEMSELMAAFLKYLPLRGLASFSGGGLTDESLDSLLERLNQANFIPNVVK